MNYFNHVIFFFELIEKDTRLTTKHICIYWVLLHIWNKNHFNNPISVKKKTLMYYSRIGSAHTYYNCVKDLHSWGYFVHEAGLNSVIKSQFYIIEFNEDIIVKIIGAFTSAKIAQVQKCTDAILQQLPMQNSMLADAEMHACLCKSASNIYTNTNTSIYSLDKEKNISKNFNNSFIGKRKKIAQKKENEIPLEKDVIEFFLSEKNSETVATKFFLYYSSLGWKTKNDVPIFDWKSLARLWMQNERTNLQSTEFINHNNVDYDEKL